MRLFLGAFLLLAICLPARAEGTLQQVQRELRARKYYFGPVDGRASPEAKRAIQEFQRAKALDATGEADEETLRALGLRRAAEVVSPEAQAQKLGREWIARYCRACESGEWAGEVAFYGERVRYYYEGEMSRDQLRELRVKYYALWPTRRQTPVLSFTTWNPRRQDELWVSARVRHEVKNREGTPTVFTEELLFILRPGGRDWQLVEVREWPMGTSKGLR